MDSTNSIPSNPHLNKRQVSCILILVIFCLLTYIMMKHVFSSNLSLITNENINFVSKNSSSDDCKWRFDHYSPSPWELFWYNNILTLQNNVCAVLSQTDQKVKSIQILEYIIDLQKRIYNEPKLLKEYDKLFSKIYYRYQCLRSSQSTNLLVSQYIEPLVGLLRDPLTICAYQDLPKSLKIDQEMGVQSKRFYLLGPSAPYHNFRSPTKSIAPWLYQEGSQKILLDIGASLFDGVGDDKAAGIRIGAKWFYEYFRVNSLRFDRIITFDIDLYSPKIYWDQIPDDLMGILTFIDIGVQKEGKFNPWNVLKTIAKVDDYVIIKLDIDTPALENVLIQQILNNTSISSLIDEMFFEMHVTVKDMMPYWASPGGQLKDTYVLFNRLRQLGIRMHSWP